MAHTYYLQKSGDSVEDDANDLHTTNRRVAGSGKSHAGAGTLDTGNLSAGSAVQWATFTTEASGVAAGLANLGSWPGVASWPTGQYRMVINVTQAGGDMTYGCQNLGTAIGHIARINRAGSAHVGATQNGGTATGTGIKTFQVASWTPPAGSWDDRLEFVLCASRAAGGHGNESATLELSPANPSVTNGGVITTPHGTTPAALGGDISRVGVTTAFVDGNATITGTYPAGVQADDLVVVSIGHRRGDGNGTPATWPTVPAGFTSRGRQTSGSETMETWWYISDGSDPTLTFVADQAEWQGMVVTAYRGVDQTTPFDVADVVATGRSDLTITPTTDGAVLVWHATKNTGFTRNHFVPTRSDDIPLLYPGGAHSTAVGKQVMGAMDFYQATAGGHTISSHREDATGMHTRLMALRPAAAGNLEATVSPAAESDVAQPVAFDQPVPAVVTPSAETDTPQPIAFTQPIVANISPATESDVAQPIATAQAQPIAVTPAVESDVAPSIAKSQGGATGDPLTVRASGRASQLRVDRLRGSGDQPINVPVGAAAETDVAQPVAFDQAIAGDVGPATEVDRAELVIVDQNVPAPVAAATESDQAQAVAFDQPVPAVVAAATESDQAQAVAFDQNVPATVAPASETDAAQPVGFAQNVPASVAAAAEMDTAQPITADQVTPAPVAVAAETDTPQPVTVDQNQAAAVGPATETDRAELVTVDQNQIAAVTAASETDTAQPVTASQDLVTPVTPASETDTAQPVTVDQNVPAVVAPAAESDTPQPVGIDQANPAAVAAASETDVAQAIGVSQPFEAPVTPAVETDQAQPITTDQPGAASVAPAAETDVAQPVAFDQNQPANVTPASETDTPQPIGTVVGSLLVNVAAAVETAIAAAIQTLFRPIRRVGPNRSRDRSTERTTVDRSTERRTRKPSG